MEWLGFYTYFFEGSRLRALPKLQTAFDNYEKFLRNNSKYSKFIWLRQMYLMKLTESREELFTMIKKLVDLEDKYKSDKQLEASFTSFKSFV